MHSSGRGGKDALNSHQPFGYQAAVLDTRQISCQEEDKEQTASAVKVVIKNYLFDKLPFPAYEEADIEVRTEVLFAFFKGRYAVGMAA